MIEVHGLTKRYGARVVVDDLTFTVEPGRVTGFLGPNGAGKSTTMRMILGLAAPSAGHAWIEGRPYRSFDRPLRRVGALLDAGAMSGGRGAYHHLASIAASNDIPRTRVEEVLERTGLCEVARRRVGGFSLGMKQRLGIAAALLGEPRVLLLDEPVNGLDPDGVRWIRTLMRELAAEGRTVFVSSHLMSEMALTADHVIVLGRGRVIVDTDMAEFVRTGSRGDVLVRSPHGARLARLLTEHGASVTAEADGALAVTDLAFVRIGELAAAHGLVIHELAARQGSLEEAYLRITEDEAVHRAVHPVGGAGAVGKGAGA
ncbi:ABC transporter ATP-binding protein [Embleya scabrispora]|uniref:ABC transporter ATP-binding protein n=1 Tax=Embleya scabrispora TaxID=159449 RepID=UPI00039B888F|nr:ATP-binding cassette domain-containing protein [Embleya scabrispora]MYS87566.1 ATP-binding cassette domain-containing protein [Streptomyces sp. SID5474]